MTGGRLVLIVAGAAVAAAAVSGVLVSIVQHKQEARNPFFRVVELNEETVDPAVWGAPRPPTHRTVTE